ncbi:DNA ligase 1-like [Prorops nasuta]
MRTLLETVDDITDLETIDPDDIDQEEADFSQVGQSYNMHLKEKQVAKDKLKQQITAEKVFKEHQPSFLTYVEKEEIKSLHKNDPNLWTPEELSKSFPALPTTIKKILKSKWSPDSAERIIDYDNYVSKNWEKFKSGELVLSDQLEEHLKKFQNRKIVLIDRVQLAEKFVPPKIELPKPRNTYFSNIVQSYIEAKENRLKLEETNILHSDKDKSENIVEETGVKVKVKHKNETTKFQNTETYNKMGANVKVKPKNIKKVDKTEDTLSEENTKVDYEAQLAAKAKSMGMNIPKSEKNKLVAYTNYTSEEAVALKATDHVKVINQYVETACIEDTDIDDYQRQLQLKAKSMGIKPLKFETLNNSKIENQIDLVHISRESCEKHDLEFENKQYRYRSSNNKSEKHMTFSEFLSENVEEMSEQIKEGISDGSQKLILDIYKKEKELKNDIAREENENTLKTKPELNDLEIIENNYEEYVPGLPDNDSTETGIKLWRKKIDTTYKYTKPIKVPEHLRKKHLQIRIKDCYYDYDGEFLYRVPNVRN